VRFIAQELTRPGQRSIVESFPDRQASRGEMLLGFSDRVFSKMKNTGSEHGIGAAYVQNIGEVFQFSRTSTGNHWYADRL
jgi:hypothetical protein